MKPPVLITGVGQIAYVLDISKRQVVHMHRQRQLPTFVVQGGIFATDGALRDWLMLQPKAE